MLSLSLNLASDFASYTLHLPQGAAVTGELPMTRLNALERLAAWDAEIADFPPVARAVFVLPEGRKAAPEAAALAARFAERGVAVAWSAEPVETLQ